MGDEAYKLFHQGALALADMERNGIKVDIDYCKRQQADVSKQIIKLESELEKLEEIKVWRTEYKDKFNIDSNTQLGKILFGHFNIKPPKLTAKGNASVDKDSLYLIKSDIVKPLIRLRQLKKVNNTYLGNIIEETTDGIIHPFFNLHTVKTFRSSSDKPNFQNMPIRDPEMGRIIRQAFVSRFKGGYIGGFDYGALELSMAGCNSKDPKLIENFGTIHKIEAANCYALKQEEVTKNVRYCGKNKFVFPQLYGSWFGACAPALLGAIAEMKLETVQGDSLKNHLRAKGLLDRTKFENHIKGVEKKFWEEYNVHKRWQDKWIADYQKKGYIELLTGFKCSGILSKNKLLNYANQGPGFHCLLWSIVKTNKWLKKNKMKSLMIGQIHDDMLLDIHPEEYQDVLHCVKKIMCDDLKKAWPWIITPLIVEAEFSNINWYEKKEVDI